MRMKFEQNLTASTQKTRETGKFARDVIWIAAAQLFASIVFGIITLPALTKTYSTEIFGVWTQIYVTVTLLAPVFCLELDMAVVRFLAPEDDKTRMRKALGSMLMSIFVVSAIVFAIVNLLAPQLSVLLFGVAKYSLFVRLTFLWVISQALFVFFSAYLRARKRIKLLAVRTLMLNVMLMALVISLASEKVNLEWIVASAIIVQVVFVLVFLVMIVREVGWPVPNVSGLKSYLAFSVPQIPAVVLLWFISSSDRYFITHLINLSEAGIFGSSGQLGNMTRLFYAPITFVLFPTLARLWEERRLPEVKSYLQQSTRLFLTLGIPASVGIALFSQPLLTLLTTSEYLAGKDLVFLISFGTLFMGIFQINSYVILLEKRTKLLPLMIAVASATSIGLNIMLLPRIGIVGAGIANMSSYIILATIVTLMARRSLKYSFDFMFLAKIIGATTIMGAVLYFLKLDGVLGILLGIAIGSAVYSASLFVFRAFSDKDKRTVAKTIGELIPGYLKRRG